MDPNLPPIPSQIENQFNENYIFIQSELNSKEKRDKIQTAQSGSAAESFRRFLRFLDTLVLIIFALGVIVSLHQAVVDKDLFFALFILLIFGAPYILFSVILWIIKPNFERNGPVDTYEPILFTIIRNSY